MPKSEISLVVGQRVVCYALVVHLTLFIVAMICSLLMGVVWVLGVVLSPEKAICAPKK